MAGTGGKKAVKEGQENKLKEKGKPRGKKHDSSPEQHEKEEGTTKKKRVRRLKNDSLNKIRQTEPLKGASQPQVYHFVGCLKERNVTSHQLNTRNSAQTAPSQVPERGPAQISPKKDSFPALERAKKSDKATRPKGPPSTSTSPKKGCISVAPSTPIVPCEEAAAPPRTMSRAQALALVENMALHLRLNTPSCKAHLQGLSALVPEVSLRKPKLVEVEANCLKENVTWSVAEEGRRFVDGRPFTSRKSVQWQRQEMEMQQDHRSAQKKGMGCNIEDHASNSTRSTCQRDTQSNANFHVHKDVEESGSESGPSRFGPSPASFNFLDAWRPSTETREIRPSNTQTLSALHSAIARREEMRKEMERRVEEERENKKVAFAQETHKKHRRKCTMCGN